jgi:hypothetical protein
MYSPALTRADCSRGGGHVRALDAFSSLTSAAAAAPDFIPFATSFFPSAPLLGPLASHPALLGPLSPRLALGRIVGGTS